MSINKKKQTLRIITLIAFIVPIMINCDLNKDTNTVDISKYYLDPPTGVVATLLSDRTVHITWNAVSGARQYEISARTNLDSVDTRVSLTTTANTTSDHGYYYWYWYSYSRPEEVTTIYYYIKAHPRESGYIASGWSNPSIVNVR
jgi:hypothetical protein